MTSRNEISKGEPRKGCDEVSEEKSRGIYPVMARRDRQTGISVDCFYQRCFWDPKHPDYFEPESILTRQLFWKIKEEESSLKQ